MEVPMESNKEIHRPIGKIVLSEDVRKQKIIRATGEDQGTHDYEPTYKSSERDRDEHTAEENDLNPNR